MLGIALVVLQAVPPALVHIENPAEVVHRVVMRCAWPLPRHSGVRVLGGVSVGGVPATWRPMLRWPDGALALVELRWLVELNGAATQAVDVQWRTVAGPKADDAEREADIPMRTELPIRAEIEDPWGRTLVASLSESARVGGSDRPAWQLVPVGADGRGYLGLLADLAPGYTARHSILTLSLDNGRLRPDQGSGAVRLRRFDLVSEDCTLRFLPRHARANGLALAEPVLDAATGAPTGYRQHLLGPSESIYLGDGTAKSFRFDLFSSEGATEAETAAIAAAVASPIVAFPDLAWVRHTGAFGTHGGPAPVLTENEQIGPMLAGAWHMGSDFGVFGGFGDPKAAAAHGAPRHGPSALHSVLRLRSPALLRVAEAMVLQSTLRPLPGHVARAGTDSRALRAGLSRRAQHMPHGFEALDYEHASVDLLFDHYWLTGDRLAREELARHAVALRRVLANRAFRTSRGEGWGLQALASCALATGDQELAAWLRAHVAVELAPSLRENLVAAIVQPPHREVLDGETPFDSPWQMAALVHGLHAVHRLTGDDEIAAAAVIVASRMAGPGWVEGVGPKYFVSARDPAKYEMARVGPPVDGPARFQIGAFVLAAELARDRPELAALFERRAAELVLAVVPDPAAAPPGLRSDPWFQLWLDRNAPDRPPR